jgi:putative ABC transport system permease protein
MRISDYIGQAGGNLWKKKLRTFLTTSGVVIGIGALVSMFAFGQGIQSNITDQFKKLDLFNYITVLGRRPGGRPPSFDPDEGGEYREEHRRRRVEEGGRGARDANQPTPPLNAQTLRQIEQIKGVQTAFPEVRFPAQVRLGDREEFTMVQVLSSDVVRSGLIQLRAGQAYESNDVNELLISVSLLRRLGVRDPASAVGRDVEVSTLTLDFRLGNLLQMLFPSGPTAGGSGPGAVQALPFARDDYRFRIAGAAREMGFTGPLPIRSDVFVPPGMAARMRKLSVTSVWELFEPASERTGYATVSVKVRSPEDVPYVKDQLESRGYRTFAMIDQFSEMRIGFLIMDAVLIAVGMIGITVASLGIINTMVMSILERYREIGIMKAVGATDGDVQRIFLFESGMIGLLGGAFGLGLGWVVSLTINEVANAMMARHGVPHMDYFRFPWWLCLGAVVFSILVSLAAGVYPTFRAARVDPVVALRHD